jgi:cytochrome c-type biogenesis protein CcmH
VVLFWLIIVVTAAGAVFLIARPLLSSRPADGAADDGQSIPVDEEIASIRRDLDYDLLDASTAAAAEHAAERGSLHTVPSIANKSRYGRMAAFAALGVAPLAAVFLYLDLGAPQAISKGAGSIVAQGLSGFSATQDAIPSLEERVRKSPNDFASWMALGEAYAAGDRAADAASAFSRATELDDKDANAHSALGEALVRQSNGAITGEARDAFARALDLSPGDPRARYYLAESRYQVGAIEEAVKAWALLLNDAPADASWFGAVAARMIDAAAEASLTPDDLGLSAEATRRLAQIAAPPPGSVADGGFEAAMEKIHDGSASLDDWMLAASTYAVRGETDKATEILDRAETRFQSAPFVLSQIKRAKDQLAAGERISLTAPRAPVGAVNGPSAAQVNAISALPADEQRQMIESMVADLAERLKSSPDNPDGWRMLGRSYRVLGRPEDSAAAWKKLLNSDAAGPEDWRQYVIALMETRPEGDNSVSAEMEAALVKIQSFDPDDPLALYNLGHAARNRGDKARALQLWTRLQETLPPDSPFAATLERLISETN